MLKDNLNIIDERCDQTIIWMQNYQQATARYYNSTTKQRIFEVEELVLRRVFQNTVEYRAGKLCANWKCPYRVTKVVQHRVYGRETIDKVLILRSWNVMHLKKY